MNNKKFLVGFLAFMIILVAFWWIWNNQKPCGVNNQTNVVKCASQDGSIKLILKSNWVAGESVVKDEYDIGEDVVIEVENLLGVDIYTFGCDGGCSDFEIFGVEGERIFPSSCALECNRDNTLIKSGEIKTIGVWNQRHEYVERKQEQVEPGFYEIRVNYIDSKLGRRKINEVDNNTEIDGVLSKWIEITSNDPFGMPPKGISLNCGPEDRRQELNVTINSKEDFTDYIKTYFVYDKTGVGVLDNFKDTSGNVDWNKLLSSVKTDKVGDRTIYSLDYIPEDCGSYTLKMTNDGYRSVYGCCGK